MGSSTKPAARRQEGPPRTTEPAPRTTGTADGLLANSLWFNWPDGSKDKARLTDGQQTIVKALGNERRPRPPGGAKVGLTVLVASLPPGLSGDTKAALIRQVVDQYGRTGQLPRRHPGWARCQPAPACVHRGAEGRPSTS